MHAHRAFTLVELMVVVAIIIALAALLLPALDSAQKAAAMSVCASNLRQMGHAHLNYAASNKGKYPPFREALTLGWDGQPSNGDPPGVKLEDGLLWDYFKTRDLLMCPIFRSFVNDSAIRSYSLNWNCGSTPAGTDNNNEGVSGVAAVRRPSGFAVFSEENPWAHPAYASAAINDADLVCNGWPTQDTLGTFHLPRINRYAVGYPAAYVPTHHDDLLNTGVANVNFADGHTEYKDTLSTEQVVYNDPARIKYPQNVGIAR
jgi:prepilin-type N-terminal cleavage/methylation domain-containing protein/prepilin-type processing-associated H-X9-DG protein